VNNVGTACSARVGQVAFVSSESAVNTPKEMLDYGMTKTAQLAVSRGLAEAVAVTAVTVNAILLGPTRSEILGDHMAKQAEENGTTLEEAEQGFPQALRPTSLIRRVAVRPEAIEMELGLEDLTARLPALGGWLSRMETMRGYDAAYPPHWRS
jgi:NAD(P)-dependent dehydrogenase (short-subunit alcohol dehydrogenase family)